MKVMTVIGTRPEIIRLCEMIKTFDYYFTHVLVHTGQNWDHTLYENFFKELDIRKPDYFLGCVGKDLGETIGNIISKTYDCMKKEKPDAVLILGDTNSSLSAIAAKRLKIPVFHMEAGNRCFDENVPEEINRRIVDHISDINLPYTEHARRYLLAEGINGGRIFVTGSPLTEVALKYKDKIEQSSILKKLQLQPKQYFLVSAHREENLDQEKHFFSLMEALNEVATTYQVPVIYSTHPRARIRLKEHGFKFVPLVRNIEPLGYIDYNKLQKEAICVLSDSGSLAEEAAILGFPALSIRNSTERPESLEKACFTIGGIHKEEILQGIEMVRKIDSSKEKNNHIPADYQDDRVSLKVMQIIQSYTPIINEFVWRKR